MTSTAAWSLQGREMVDHLLMTSRRGRHRRLDGFLTARRLGARDGAARRRCEVPAPASTAPTDAAVTAAWTQRSNAATSVSAAIDARSSLVGESPRAASTRSSDSRLPLASPWASPRFSKKTRNARDAFVSGTLSTSIAISLSDARSCWLNIARIARVLAWRQDGAMRRAGSRLGAAGALAVPLVAACQVERRQPVLATDDPALVGRPQLVRRVEAAEMDLDLVALAPEQR